MLPLAVPIGRRAAPMSGLAQAEARIRLVLETEPGTLPWRPEFGCGLANLSGQAASPETLARVRFHVQQSFSRFLPDLSLERCEVRVVRRAQSPGQGPVPVAEAALLGLGVSADLVVELDVRSPEGSFSLRTPLDLEQRT